MGTCLYGCALKLELIDLTHPLSALTEVAHFHFGLLSAEEPTKGYSQLQKTKGTCRILHLVFTSGSHLKRKSQVMDKDSKREILCSYQSLKVVCWFVFGLCVQVLWLIPGRC